MDSGFVYIARLIDYNGNFLGSFHKIGKSKQYKIRETQLNSTHLPVDILFVRVFETDNQSALEQILHACFEDYRIQKKYEDRRNITTEWFDVDDTDVLNNRIDKIIKHIPNVNEINVIGKINSDTSTSLEDKEELVSSIKRSKTKLILKYNNEDISQDTASETYLLGLSKIAEQIGWEKLDYDEDNVSKTKDEFRETKVYSYRDNAIKEISGYYIWVSLSNQDKNRIINRHIRTNNISNLECSLEVLS
jgi:hypothetical protein